MMLLWPATLEPSRLDRPRQTYAGPRDGDHILIVSRARGNEAIAPTPRQWRCRGNELVRRHEVPSSPLRWQLGARDTGHDGDLVIVPGMRDTLHAKLSRTEANVGASTSPSYETPLPSFGWRPLRSSTTAPSTCRPVVAVALDPKTVTNLAAGRAAAACGQRVLVTLRRHARGEPTLLVQRARLIGLTRPTGR